jgi:hypothetical protein
VGRSPLSRSALSAPAAGSGSDAGCVAAARSRIAAGSSITVGSSSRAASDAGTAANTPAASAAEAFDAEAGSGGPADFDAAGSGAATEGRLPRGVGLGLAGDFGRAARFDAAPDSDPVFEPAVGPEPVVGSDPEAGREAEAGTATSTGPGSGSFGPAGPGVTGSELVESPGVGDAAGSGSWAGELLSCSSARLAGWSAGSGSTVMAPRCDGCGLTSGQQVSRPQLSG